jgi:hypothetical protein
VREQDDQDGQDRPGYDLHRRTTNTHQSSTTSPATITNLFIRTINNRANGNYITITNTSNRQHNEVVFSIIFPAGVL